MAILLIGIAMPVRAQSASAPLTLAEYRAELASAVDQLQAAAEDEIKATLQSLKKHFNAINQVQFESGTIVTIDSIFEERISPIDFPTIEEEQTSAEVREQMLARLQGVIAQIDASATDNTNARLALLEDVFSRAEFNTPTSLWERFWRWFEDLIRRLLPSSTGTGGGWIMALLRIIPWLVTIIVAIVVIFLLTYWLQRLLMNFVNDARNAEIDGDDDLPRTAAEARQQAHEAAQSGLYRDAVRRLYLAALLQLSESDLIPFERSLTNREVLMRVTATSPLRPHLEPVVNTFDQVWYGIHEPDLATFTAYEQEIDALATVATQIAKQISAEAEQHGTKGKPS